ncbi:MAG: plasmid pRiA4b ORF-3 family protein [Planctomycetota bacterium]|nr:plasmid pRiA4b ORF-3 family protein [Planctomycetota bacterium]
MAARKPEAEAQLYQLKVTLRGAKPPIWRRLQVPSDIPLSELHVVLLIAMGWDGGHLHQFIKEQVYYGPVDPDLGMDDMEDEKGVVLRDLLPHAKSKLIYEYDFGDSWEHEVLVEKVLAPETNTRYPVCLDGARACPPEDCGGVWGYAELLKIMKDPKHEEYAERLEWLGEELDPEAFDVARVNAELQSRKP